MNRDQLAKLKQEVKQGSMGALMKVLRSMHTESQKNYNLTSTDHRFYQSRVLAQEEIIALLPEAFE